MANQVGTSKASGILTRFGEGDGTVYNKFKNIGDTTSVNTEIAYKSYDTGHSVGTPEDLVDKTDTAAMGA